MSMWTSLVISCVDWLFDDLLHYRCRDITEDAMLHMLTSFDPMSEMLWTAARTMVHDAVVTQVHRAVIEDVERTREPMNENDEHFEPTEAPEQSEGEAVRPMPRDPNERMVEPWEPA